MTNTNAFIVQSPGNRAARFAANLKSWGKIREGKVNYILFYFNFVVKLKI
jgi:hypothetical protein